MAASRIKLLGYSALRNGYESEMNRLDEYRSDFQDGLLEAHRFVDLLRRTNELPYAQRFQAGGFRQWQETGSMLVKYKDVLNGLSEPFLARFHLSPQINALVQVGAMFRLPRYSWPPNALSRGLRGKPCAEVFNALVETVRERASVPGFNKPVVARRAAALADCVSATALVKSVSSTTKHVLVSRLDLMYRESLRSDISPRKLKDDLAAFLNNWRKHRLHKVLKGYLWKLQYGSVSGYYVHLIALLDAGRMDLSIDPIRECGKLWEVVTSGCGEVKTPGQHVPIFSGGSGVWKDKRKDKATLLEGIYYLLQKDQYFRVNSGSSPRLFGKSELS